MTPPRRVGASRGSRSTDRTALPPFVRLPVVQERLLAIFPEGFPYRNACTRGTAAATVFTMLYLGAVEGSGVYLAPRQVTRMTDEQAARVSDAARRQYAQNSSKQGFTAAEGTRWYAENTREPIRDETIRQGLISAGAATERKDLPTTSGHGRYALEATFAALFDPKLQGEELESAIERWRGTHLSAAALARLEVVRAGAAGSPTAVTVRFPNGEVRHLVPGPSSVITKAVVEEFAPRFLATPAVIWVSESGNKVVARDDALAKRIGLHIDPARNLPDVILADVGADEIIIVFVEVVATDGPVSEARRRELLALAAEAGFDESNVAFVTAFLDRASSAFRKTLPTLAWSSFVWLAAEPGKVIGLLGTDTAAPPKLHVLLRAARLW